MIAQEDPTCAMAYWGVAISQRPNPLVGPFPGNVLKAGQEAIEKARAAQPKTERERGWIEALAAFYHDYEQVPQRTRTANYEAAMARLYARHPDDAEVAIFYALALNEAADPIDKTYAKPLKAAAILEKLQPRYPNHPGIPHYLIHSYDYPELAIRGVIAANRCAQLAPSAPHALHMPSHVYSTLGMWHEVIRSDLASDEMTRSYTVRVNPGAAADQARNPARYHSLDFLINAHLQLAQDQRAKAILEIRNSFGDSEFPPSIRYSMHTAYAAIPVRYAFERDAWGKLRRCRWRARFMRRPRPSPGSVAPSGPPAAVTRLPLDRQPSSCARLKISSHRQTTITGPDKSIFRKRPPWLGSCCGKDKKTRRSRSCAGRRTSKTRAVSTSRWRTACHLCANCSANCCWRQTNRRERSKSSKPR